MFKEETGYSVTQTSYSWPPLLKKEVDGLRKCISGNSSSKVVQKMKFLRWKIWVS